VQIEADSNPDLLDAIQPLTGARTNGRAKM
jgi:hypothetical protein